MMDMEMEMEMKMERRNESSFVQKIRLSRRRGEGMAGRTVVCNCGFVCVCFCVSVCMAGSVYMIVTRQTPRLHST